MPRTEDAYLPIDQATRRVKVARMTLPRAVKRGPIAPACQTPGGCVRVNAATSEAYAHRFSHVTAVAKREQA